MGEIVEEYKDTLTPYSYQQLDSISNILEYRENKNLDSLLDGDLDKIKRGVAWANKTDNIRKSYAMDVIKDYPFLQEWWAKINSL